MEHRGLISIWFFIGTMLLIYGAAILGSGLFEMNTPGESNVVLGELHAAVWWGILMLIIGSIYTFRFAPWRKK